MSVEIGPPLALLAELTHRCPLRCPYCSNPLALERASAELDEAGWRRVLSEAAALGVLQVHFSGGEPLVRRDLPQLIRMLAAIEGIEDLALTTNGVLLGDHARELYDAGLRRLNIHLDTLDRERFKQITRRDELEKVLKSIEIARETGFGPIKINAVAVKNLVEADIVPLARYGRERGIEIRYIEFMPLDSQGLWDRGRVLLADQMIDMLEREIGKLEVIPDRDTRAPATEYRFSDGIGQVGFIASVSRPFCLNCNRIRLTSDGKLRYCLFAIEETDVRELLRNGAADDEIRDAIRGNVHAKWMGHEINSTQFVPPPRPMYSIGG